MPANTLPPYLHWEYETDDRMRQSRFSDFPPHHRHPAAPLVMCRDLYQNAETTGPMHHTDFLSLYAVRSGRGIHRIGSHPYGVVRGDVYLMASGTTHSFSQFKDLEIDVFHFQIGIFSAEELSALRQCPGIWRLFADDIDVHHRIHASPTEWQDIETQIDVLRNEWGERSPESDILLRHEFFHLLILLARLQQRQNGDSSLQVQPARQDMGLAEALRYCEEHFDKPLTVSQLAARCFLSRSHFTEVFSRQIGMAPAAYIRRIRLEKARNLLRQSEMPVAQIAVNCGFGNAAQFSRAFRDFYDESPLQYRKKNAKSA